MGLETKGIESKPGIARTVCRTLNNGHRYERSKGATLAKDGPLVNQDVHRQCFHGSAQMLAKLAQA